MGHRRWGPILAALSVVLSAAIGVTTNVVTQSRTIALIGTAGGLILLAAGLAWWDGRSRLVAGWTDSGSPGPPPAGGGLVVRYAPTDRSWAHWISAEIAHCGAAATLQTPGRPDLDDVAAPATTSGAADRVLIVVSRHSVRWLSPDADTTTGRRLLVRVDDAPLPARLTDVLDLTGLSAGDARAALRSVLGLAPSAGEAAGTDRDGLHPFPGTPPRVWNLPQRHPAFVGRQATIESLRDRLAAGTTVVLPEAIYGLGGVGKTQTAIEYAYRYATEYEAVWWIPAEHPSLVRESLASLAGPLGVSAGEGLANTVPAVLNALRQGRPYFRWLLIYDNAEDPDGLRDLIAHGTGHVLITSRNPAWGQRASAVELGVFDRAESIALLRRHVATLADSEAHAVAAALGDLPLAVEQAGAWLAATAMPVGPYLDLLDQQPAQVLDDDPPSGYGRMISASWLASLERLHSAAPAAAALLELCACFAPEPVPLRLLLESERCVATLLPIEPSMRDGVGHARIVREIHRSGLARVDAERRTIHIHRLVQAVIQATLPPETVREHRQLIGQILATARLGDLDDPRHWPAYAELWPHLAAADVAHSTQPHVRELVVTMARYLFRRGDYRGCRELADTALAHWLPAFGHDDPTALALRVQLCNATRGLADYVEAYDIGIDVHRRLARTRGEDHPHTLTAANGLGSDLRIRGEYARARSLDEDTLARARTALGDDHPLTLRAANNLAVSLRMLGRYPDAAALHEDTVRRLQARLDGDHLDALHAAISRGLDLQLTGDLPGSRALLTDVVDTLVRIDGPSHPRVLLASITLAATLHACGSHADAHALTTGTWPRCVAVLGPTHLHTLACAVNLGREQSALGDHPAALDTTAHAQARYASLFDDSHPFTLICTNNLAVFQHRLGDRSARHLAERAATGLRERLGPAHPYALGAMMNVANVLYDTGHPLLALKIDQEVYPAALQRLGEHHHQTLAAAANLATSLRHQADRRGSRRLSTQPLQRVRTTLGAGNSAAAAIAAGRRIGWDLVPLPT